LGLSGRGLRGYRARISAKFRKLFLLRAWRCQPQPLESKVDTVDTFGQRRLTRIVHGRERAWAFAGAWGRAAPVPPPGPAACHTVPLPSGTRSQYHCLRSPARKAVTRGVCQDAETRPKHPIWATFARCCARAASGHAAAAPPSSVMNLRRFMCGWPPPGKRKCSVPHRSRLQSCVRPVHAVRMDCWP
jgi:hypothetical protein